jgi:hypothetical protein
MPTPNPNAAIFEAYAKDMGVKIEVKDGEDKWLPSSIGSVLQYPHNTYRLKPKFLNICGYQAAAPVEKGHHGVLLQLVYGDTYVNTVHYKHATAMDATAHFNLLAQASIPE